MQFCIHLFLMCLTVFFFKTQVIALTCTEDEKIVGGFTASLEKWKFIASILRNGELLCGGSLINKDWVLTAAHCALQPGDEVAIGSHDLRKYKEGEVRKVEKFISHPDYSNVYNGNDIALAKLDQATTSRGYAYIPGVDNILRFGHF